MQLLALPQECAGKIERGTCLTSRATHASSNSIVGEISAHKTAMEAAVAETDRTEQTADITAAREQLASDSKKQLTADAITKVDGMLGITGAAPALGTTN